MNRFPYLLILFSAAWCGEAATTHAPIPDESLDYAINWPSGLSLGEAHWKAHNSGTAQAPVWEFSFDVDAHVPAYGLSDSYKSKDFAEFCTEKLSKDQQHGARKTGESETVDPKA